MTEREELLKRLERIKALADRGVGGEKENAEALLQRLMQKYNITEEDIEKKVERIYWIRYKTDLERKLIYQIAYKHCGSGHACRGVGTYSGRSKKLIGVTCTPSIYIEVEADFEFYREALKEDLDIFMQAFIHKNDIFPDPELVKDEPKSDFVMDRDRALKITAIMDGIDQRTRHKALPTSCEEAE